MAIRAAVPTASTTLGGVRRRGHSKHGGHGNNSEDCLSHVNLFEAFAFGSRQTPGSTSLTRRASYSVVSVENIADRLCLDTTQTPSIFQIALPPRGDTAVDLAVGY
jgi:hypothetical protein